MKTINGYEIYSEEEEVKKVETKSPFKKMWDNTIGKKIEENREEDELRRQARQEAKEEIKEVLKKKYIEDEIKKASEPKKNFFAKLGEEFKAIPATDDKLDRMIGREHSYKTENLYKREKTEPSIFGNVGNKLGQAPKIDVEKYLTRDQFPETKTDNIKLQKGRFENNIKRALGK